LSPNKINLFLLLKLPSAYLCGVRLKYIDNTKAIVSVKHKWINQNPFRSLYFAVQQMAAELSTGALVMQAIKNQNIPISMLVIGAQSKFYKKATGRIKFECNLGLDINETVKSSIRENASQSIKIPVKAYNSDGILVSEFSFEWSIKPKTNSSL
jgi:hypothetical protein